MNGLSIGKKGQKIKLFLKVFLDRPRLTPSDNLHWEGTPSDLKSRFYTPFRESPPQGCQHHQGALTRRGDNPDRSPGAAIAIEQNNSYYHSGSLT